MQLLAHAKQDAEVLKTLSSTDFKTKQASFLASKASGAEDLDAERLKSEFQEMAPTGKRVSTRHEADRSGLRAFVSAYQRITSTGREPVSATPIPSATSHDQ